MKQESPLEIFFSERSQNQKSQKYLCTQSYNNKKLNGTDCNDKLSCIVVVAYNYVHGKPALTHPDTKVS